MWCQTKEWARGKRREKEVTEDGEESDGPPPLVSESESSGDETTKRTPGDKSEPDDSDSDEDDPRYEVRRAAGPRQGKKPERVQEKTHQRPPTKIGRKVRERTQVQKDMSRVTEANDQDISRVSADNVAKVRHEMNGRTKSRAGGTLDQWPNRSKYQNYQEARYPGWEFAVGLPAEAWRQAELYTDACKRAFCPAGLLLAVWRGTQLTRVAKGYKQGAAAFRAVYVTRYGSTATLKGLDDLKQFLDPLLIAHLKSVIVNGAQARYDGERGVRRVGKPYPSVQGEHIEEMFTKLWKDVREGRIFLSAAEEFMSDVMACCLARVPKLLPNREISDEGRYVLNLKPTNAGSGKERHPIADTPKHADVVRAVIIKQLLWPRVKVMMSKRDIEGAFKRIFRAIKDIDLFATDLPFTWVMESIFKEWKNQDPTRWSKEEAEVWEELHKVFGPKLNSLTELKALVAFVTAFNLSLEFGSSAAPGEFRQFAKAAEVATQKSGCARVDIDGPGGFTMFTWVDDGIGVEAFLGLRPFIAIRVYEDHVRTALGADAIQLEKMAEEGETAEQVRAWGIDIDSANRKHYHQRKWRLCTSW